MNILLYCPETEKKKVKMWLLCPCMEQQSVFSSFHTASYYYFVLSIFHKKKIQKFNDSSVSLYDEA